MTAMGSLHAVSCHRSTGRSVQENHKLESVPASAEISPFFFPTFETGSSMIFDVLLVLSHGYLRPVRLPIHSGAALAEVGPGTRDSTERVLPFCSVTGSISEGPTPTGKANNLSPRGFPSGETFQLGCLLQILENARLSW